MKNVMLEVNPSRDLNNAEHYQFIGSHLTHLGALGSAKLTDPKFNEIISECTAHYQVMERLLVRIRENTKSKQLAHLDHVRDVSYGAFTAALKFKSYSLVVEEQQAVAEIYALLKPHGNVARHQFDVESGTIDAIVAQLEGPKYSPLVTLLGLTPPLARLKADNNGFKELFTARTSDAIAKDTTDMREVRNHLFVAYTNLCDYAVVMARMEVSPVFDEVVTIINTIRAQYSTLVAHKQSGKKFVDNE